MTTDFLLHHHVAAGRFVGNGNDGGVTAFLVQFRHHGHFVGHVQVGPFGMRQGFVLFDFIDGRLLVSIGNGGLAHHVVHGLAEIELGLGGSVEDGF